jgi:homoserine O-acetyltransferase
MRAFLAGMHGPPGLPVAPARPRADAGAEHAATSIFEAHQLERERLLALIPTGAGVLDLGCGRGELMTALKRRGHDPVVGVEHSAGIIAACIDAGHDVIDSDLNEPLSGFADGQFDCVVLSRTLESIVDTEMVLGEMLRIGARGVVSFPNFAFRPLRERLYREGRSPTTGSPEPTPWYASPHRRMPTIADMESFCRQRGITIHQTVFLDTAAGTEVADDPNLNADVAIFVLSASRS